MIPTNPTVSVLMSVHNGRKYLAEAVESILKQTFKHFEFIVVEDGSTDGSDEMLKCYARLDPRIRLVSQENQGLTRSLNTGLSIARGEFIARMDSDDIAYPQRLEVQLELLRRSPELVCVGAEVELITEHGICLGPRHHPREHDAIRASLLTGDGGAMTHPVIMFRRTALEKIGGYDEHFDTAQDLDFYLRLSEIGKLENLNETLLKWRQHPDSVNRKKSETWSLSKSLAIEKTIARIGGKDYARQLFKVIPHFSFPADRISLGNLALRNGRNREAAHFFLIELKNGKYRYSAIKNLFFIGNNILRLSFQRVLRLFIKY